MTAPAPAPAPRTAWTWTSHCAHCTWRVLRYGLLPVGTFPTAAAVAEYIATHPEGPKK